MLSASGWPFWALLAGTIAAAVGASVFAARKFRQSQTIKSKQDTASEKKDSVIENVAQKGRDLVNKGKSLFGNAAKTTKEVVDEKKEALLGKKESAVDKAGAALEKKEQEHGLVMTHLIKGQSGHEKTPILATLKQSVASH